jgi:UDP-galactopyranose mutase
MVKNILIIGAGYAGCCLANMLSADHKVTLIEKTDSPGGMCKTYYLDGLPYEYGPHILAYHNCSEEAIAYVRRHLDFTETRLSSASVIDGKIAAYPPSLQSAKDLGVLDTVKEELQSLPEVPNESNFETYLIDKVGPTLYELYFKHFTKKFWGVKPSFLSASWAKTRHLGESVTDDEMFFNKIWCGYPSSDWNDLFKNLLDDRIQVYLSCPITSINLSDSFIITSSGEKFYFDLLISTTPIDFYSITSMGNWNMQDMILNQRY